VDFEFKGPIYPINPKADVVRDIKAYPTIHDVPGEIDLVHIVIPNKFVPQAIEDCGKKGVKVVIVNTAGFKEVGEEGEALEDAVCAKAKEYGIRVFGPNCQGIINTDPEVRAYCNFTFTKPEEGFISIAAQSGGVAEVINQRFSELGVGVRMYASNGNACDISITEVLKYWADDEKTRVIVLYVEGLSEPHKFMEVLKEVTAKKPVLAMKAGRTEEGAKAASSHTGGLAKQEITTELIFKKAGALTFRDEEELCQAAVAFASQPIPRGNRVGMITNTGGPAIIATDELVDAGLQIPPLSEKAKVVLKEKLYSAASISNPIDVLATAGAEHFRAAMDVMLDEEGIDSLYINFVTPFFVDTDSIAKEIAAVTREKRKPVICNLMTDKRQWTETLRILKEGEVPSYSFPETAARALIALTRYSQLSSRDTGKVDTFVDVDRSKAGEIITQAKEAGRKMLAASDVYTLLSAYGIPVAGWQIVQSAEEAEKAAAEIGFPVVVKADSETIIHKSDMGGVAVNLKDGKEVLSTVKSMKDTLGDNADLKFFIQKYLPGGREIIIGAKAEQELGHLVLFGIGGVYVELLKDVAFELTPVTDTEVKDMISSIKSYPLLSGFRGEKGVNQDALAETLQRVSQLVTELPMIQEMDLNPIMAFEDNIFIVDARISI
jgi:acetyltransferase